MTEITIPTIHLNGSSKQSLIDGLSKAMEAIRLSVDAMHDCTPNGRDYYVQSPTATDKARTEHGERTEALQRVHDELMEIAVGIDQQEGR